MIQILNLFYGDEFVNKEKTMICKPIVEIVMLFEVERWTMNICYIIHTISEEIDCCTESIGSGKNNCGKKGKKRLV